MRKFNFHSYVPHNYREVSIFPTLTHEIQVAGLASPDYCDKPRQVMQFLKKKDIQTIFGLEPTPELESVAKELKINYINIQTRDFRAPDIALYDKIYTKMLEEDAKGKKIAIHCLQGNGRTGTILAALKLKELANNNPDFYKAPFEKKFIALPFVKPAPCSENVYAAICSVRAINPNAVESEEQVNALMSYEEGLKKIHAATLSAEQSTFLSV